MGRCGTGSLHLVYRANVISWLSLTALYSFRHLWFDVAKARLRLHNFFVLAFRPMPWPGIKFYIPDPDSAQLGMTVTTGDARKIVGGDLRYCTARPPI